VTTAREEFEARKLEARYGVVGKVAARYRRAGYEVKVESAEASADVHFTAKRRGELLIAKVYWAAGRVPVEAAEAIARVANEKGGKPLLVLYGAGPKSHADLVSKAKELGVSLKRVRP